VRESELHSVVHSTSTGVPAEAMSFGKGGDTIATGYPGVPLPEMASPFSRALDRRSFLSDISVMTEITVAKRPLPPAIERFVVHWGEMGERWAVNRSVAQIHALLFVSDRPLTAEDIAQLLALARSNVSSSLKELMSWNLVRRVHVLGDRRDYFEAEADMLEMVRRIATGRKAREIDPALGVLKSCIAEAHGDARISPTARRRLAEMLAFTETAGKSFDEIMSLPTPTLARLIKTGGAVARLVGGGRQKRVPRR
jgi:DNA-binding transcriptional regulator GbsR (MarR family)